MKEYTGYNDKNSKPINEGDLLYNSFVGDIWIVELTDNVYRACLIPNSGFIGHTDIKYPAHTVDLDDINDVFEVIGNRYDSIDLMQKLFGGKVK